MSQAAAAKQVLIVDDHVVVRRGVRALIESETDLVVCGEAEDVPQAMQLLIKTKPDIVIVDLSLKSGHGLDLIGRIRSHGERPYILVLSMHDEKVYADRVLRAGAQGYVNKCEADSFIIEAIRHVLADQVYLSPAMRKSSFQQDGRLTKPSDGVHLVERLSDRELSVYELIGRGFSTRKIAEHLHLSVKTIETYREQVKFKLNLRNAAELSREAVRWVVEQEKSDGHA